MKIRSPVFEFLHVHTQTDRHGEVNRRIFGDYRCDSAKHVLKICFDPIFSKSSTITTKYNEPYRSGPRMPL